MQIKPALNESLFIDAGALGAGSSERSESERVNPC